MTNKVDIANMALVFLGEDTITSLASDNKAARTMNRLVDQALRSELERHPWTFAIARVELAPDSATPAFGYDNQFTLPGNCIRVLLTKVQNHVVKEGRKLLSDDDSVELVYVKEVTDLNDAPPLFHRVLAYRLAVDAALPLTNSNSVRDSMRAGYQDAVTEARRSNAFQGPATDRPEDSWIEARL